MDNLGIVIERVVRVLYYTIKQVEVPDSEYSSVQSTVTVTVDTAILHL